MILVSGDCLIDFMPARAADGRDAYVPAVGGSSLNVAVAAARLGAEAGFVGGISTDMFGETIAQHMRDSGVDLSRVTRSTLGTTLAFVRYEGAHARYAFFDESSAARLWRFDPAKAPLAGVSCLHFGSTTLINEPASSETRRMVEAARAGATIALDPNCRPSMIADIGAYRRKMDSLLALADIVKVSNEDLDYLRPGAVAERAAADWLGAGAALVVVTAGETGATAYARAGSAHRPARPVKIADTIGAGDTFQAALLVWLSENGRLGRGALRAIDADQAGAALEFASRAAAITCSRPGADPPWRRELDAFV